MAIDRTPRRRREEPRAARTGGRGRRVVILLVAGLLPLAAIVWFLLQPAEDREAIQDRFPAGVGGRAIAAGVAFGLLVLLARVALPAIHGALGFVESGMARLAARPPLLRALLAPVEFLLAATWLFLQALFAVDAFLILLAAAVGLLLVARIVMPEILPQVLPGLGG